MVSDVWRKNCPTVELYVREPTNKKEESTITFFKTVCTNPAPRYWRSGAIENMQVSDSARFGFFMAVFVASLSCSLVSLHPLGLDVKGVGIHQRQPGYLPTYNGIFSIHALNFTDVPLPYAQQQVVTNNASSLPTEGQPDNDRPENQEIGLFSEDGTGVNEVDFEQKIPISDLTTFPQLQVMTQTIGDVAEDRDDERTEDIDQGTIQNDTTTEQIRTDSESLQEGSEGNEEDSNQNTQKPESEDLFDRLMRTIQGHWLEFVGKMKMSVLDVWKSISHSMMERLETFATDV